MIYLDNNASTPMSSTVKSAISKGLMRFAGNPSSMHPSGRIARRGIEQVRDNLACWFHVRPEHIVFTSGATEANNTVLQSVAQFGQEPRILTTPVEHPSVLQSLEAMEARGASVQYLKVSKNGLVDIEGLGRKLFSRPDLVSIQWVNNETGIIQPIEQIMKMCASQKVPFHVDAAQAVGKLPIDFSVNQPDYFTFSGHKLHAPAGIGALVCKNTLSLNPLMFGGGQERGLRSGTENSLGIIGLGAAVNERRDQFETHITQMASLRDQLESQLLSRLPFIKIIGSAVSRIPNTSNIMFTGIDGQALVAQLYGQDICCSQTSACSNQRPEPSYVLQAMGLSEEEAYSCVRFSVSPLNTESEIEQSVEIIVECVGRLLAFSGGLG